MAKDWNFFSSPKLKMPNRTNPRFVCMHTSVYAAESTGAANSKFIWTDLHSKIKYRTNSRMYMLKARGGGGVSGG